VSRWRYGRDVGEREAMFFLVRVLLLVAVIGLMVPHCLAVLVRLLHAGRHTERPELQRGPFVKQVSGSEIHLGLRQRVGVLWRSLIRFLLRGRPPAQGERVPSRDEEST